jgi:tetratricopeptide (TPR) repeat protein
MIRGLDVVTAREARQRIEMAKAKRAEGNAAFKAGDYAQALQMYSIIPELTCFHCPSPALAPEHREAVVLGRLNMIACYIHLRDFESALAKCSEVLAIDPANVKALYRRAQAHLELSSFSRALNSVDTALQHSPVDPALAQLRETIVRRKREHEAAEKALLSKMFKS